MEKKYSYLNTKTFIIFTLIYLEIILRISIFKNIHLSFLFTILFSISLGILIHLLTRLFNKIINLVLYTISILIICLYFTIQILYYQFFKVFFTLYSAGNGSQITEFWKDIIILIQDNWIWIVLCFMPFLIFLLYLKKKLKFKRIKPKRYFYHLSLSLFIFIIGYGLLYIPSSSLNTPLDIYKERTMDEMSVDKFGLLTALRFDIHSLIFGKEEIDIDIQPPIDVVTKPTYTTQTMPIDFNQLINETENETIKNMHYYFQNITPTKKNEYTGMFKDYNVILLTCEGFSPYAIREDVTPTLYKIANEGFQFKNFYTPIWQVSTSDGEYVAMQGLIPKSGTWSFKDSAKNTLPFTLGKQYEKLGYVTKAYHNHSYKYYDRHLSHPNLGYDYKGVGNGLNIKNQWPESDLEMMMQTVDEYINEDKFHTYYMTVSGHTNYTWNGNSMAAKNKDIVKDLPYSELAKGYIATQIELDRALEYLIGRLEEKGIADKTLIALSADHYPYGLPNENYNELANHSIEQNFELYENEFLIWSASMKEPIVVEKYGSSLDILPTLSNLLGLEYDSRLLMGQDLLSDSDPLVIFLNHSFITDKVMYNAKTNEAIWLNNTEPDQEYLKQINNIVKEKFKYSELILSNDYYKYIHK